MARDITEGRANRAIAMDVGVVSSTAVWQNTDVAYDVAVGGIPFIYAINDSRPYVRQTAPFKKDQFDNQAEPGEQSLQGWWIRSQSSFHGGDGIKFYDPSSGESITHRYADSENVNVWTKGQVTLLRNVNTITTGYPAAGLQSNGRSTHHTSSIKWTVSGTTYQGVIDGGDYNIVRITDSGAVQPLVTSTDTIYSIANDGTYVYWITNTVSGSSKLHMWKKSLNAAVGDANTLMFNNALVVSSATLTYTKERLVAGINNAVYEIPTSASALPTSVFTHTNSDHIWACATSSGPAIYVAGWNGVISSIVKFTLNTSGVMPTLTSAITAAEMPIGERVYSMRYYLGYLLIGTSKGIRAAHVSDQDGSISYGPLIVETAQPVFGFACRDRFVWCASGTTNSKQGLIRIDLGNEIEQLRFSYANDLQNQTIANGSYTVSVGFLGETDQVFFSNASSNGTSTKTITNKALTSNVATLTTSTAHGYSVGTVVYISGVGAPFDSTAGFPVGSHFVITSVPTTTTFTYAVTNSNIASTSASGTVFIAGSACWESPSTLASVGYLQTGNIRFNTLEPKNFKRLRARGEFTYGSVTLETVDVSGNIYDLISYDYNIGSPEVTTNQPELAQEYLAYRFELHSDSTDGTKGPIFKGYQAKATIATPRQRILQFPVYVFDVETDRYNVQVGYQGRAFAKIQALENIEASGDIVNFQDLSTGESRQAVIEQITFTRATPPDKRFDGFGGVAQITIRTV